MEHDEAAAFLDRYLDGELDRPSNAALEAHVAECGACTASLEAGRALRMRIRQSGLAHAAPPSLAARIRAQLDSGGGTLGTAPRPATPAAPSTQPTAREPATIPARRAFVWRHWMTSAASIVAVAGLAWMFVPGPIAASADATLMDELTADHIRSLMATHLTDVASTDRHTVKPWFATRVDFSPEVRDLTDRGFPLIGGRLDYAGGRQVASVVFQRRSHVINLFMWPASNDASVPVHPLRSRGFNIVRWARGGLEFAAVSDVDAAELSNFVSEFEKG